MLTPESFCLLAAHGWCAHKYSDMEAAVGKTSSKLGRLTGIVQFPPFFSFSILLTHEGSHREVYRDFQPSLTSSAGGAKGCSDHSFRALPAYTAQLLTLHQHRADNQHRMAQSNLADFKG